MAGIGAAASSALAPAITKALSFINSPAIKDMLVGGSVSGIIGSVLGAAEAAYSTDWSSQEIAFSPTYTNRNE